MALFSRLIRREVSMSIALKELAIKITTVKKGKIKGSGENRTPDLSHPQRESYP